MLMVCNGIGMMTSEIRFMFDINLLCSFYKSTDLKEVAIASHMGNINIYCVKKMFWCSAAIPSEVYYMIVVFVCITSKTMEVNLQNTWGYYWNQYKISLISRIIKEYLLYHDAIKCWKLPQTHPLFQIHTEKTVYNQFLWQPNYKQKNKQ